MSSLAQQLKGQPPFPPPQVIFAQAEGDLVVWVSKTKRPDPEQPEGRAWIEVLLFSMVRVEVGKLAEHWDSQ